MGYASMSNSTTGTLVLSTDLLANPSGTTGNITSVVDELIDHARLVGLSDPNSALHLLERARLLAEENGDESGRAWAILESASCIQDLGDYDQAAAKLAQAQPLFETLGNVHGLASCRNIAGILAIDEGNYEAAVRELTAAVAGFQQAERRDHEAASLYNLGKVFLRLGDYATTLDYFLRCAEIEESIAEPIDRALTYGSISAVCRDLGRHETALDFAKRGLALVDMHHEQRILSTALIEVGLSLAAVGRSDEAFTRLTDAVAVAEKAANPARARDAAIHLAELLIGFGHQTEALPHAERALAISRQLGDRFAEARALLLLWDAAGDDVDATTLDRALAIATDLGAIRQQRAAHERLARVKEATGDERAAIRHLRALVETERRIFDEEADYRSRALTIHYETERARKEAEIERLRNVELAALLAQVREQAHLLQRQATEDPLTGLANRRSLDQDLARELDRAARFEHPLAIAMLDIDHFKAINDRYSHQTGDDVIQTVARLLRHHARDVDVVARYGGEEFALIFPETPLDQAVAAAERLRLAIAGYPWSFGHPDLVVTVSIGIVPNEPGDSPADALRRADAHLYAAKRQGRNRTVSGCSFT
jgi:diguanylate cyclase (GGDEF)-like protein